MEIENISSIVYICSLGSILLQCCIETELWNGCECSHWAMIILWKGLLGLRILRSFLYNLVLTLILERIVHQF